jgi:UDP-glucose 4-epimerase
MAVHGRQSTWFGPETPVRPETDYGTTKWLAEQAIAASGCRSAVIRFGGIFGPAGPEHLGINRALRGAQAGRRPEGVGTGSAKRNYLYVEDAAAGVKACVSKGLTGLFYAGGETLTIREMLQSICDVWLPGTAPDMRAGEDAGDQVVHVSAELGPVRTFRQALDDCR